MEKRKVKEDTASGIGIKHEKYEWQGLSRTGLDVEWWWVVQSPPREFTVVSYRKLICSLPEKAVADGIRPMDVEYLAKTAIYKYLYLLDGGCCSSPSFSSIQ
ncbi:unnamed protein product [Schistosoma margrebowiei]|uniref:Uncharacterized protein n=1 Tax=Schistosoma margrebowiei TaxID=48269 RepID=A0A183MQT3_9TREM|nr:unnamed protein product [Schistosoma margrebowiei]